VALIDTDYLHQLQALLPHGPAWPTDDDTNLTRLLSGLAGELARVNGRAIQLIEEVDPRATYELFPDYCRVAFIPDPYIGIGSGSFRDEKSLLMWKLTAVGGQSVSYFTNLAAILGFAVNVDEFRPQTVDDDVEYLAQGDLWRFAWRCNVSAESIYGATVNDTVEDQMAADSLNQLESAIRHYSPVHTFVSFNYL
jgi:uncharacterized protein YmfQ (DUF2313 family)